MGLVLLWVVSSSLAMEDGFLFITDKSFYYFSKVDACITFHRCGPVNVCVISALHIFII